MDIGALIRQWSRRARWQQSARWAAVGLAIGLVIALLMAIAARFVPLLTRNAQIALSIALSLTGLLIALLLPWLRGLRRTELDWAREFDGLFGLNERMSTSLELNAGRIKLKSDELRQKQRSDTEAATQGIDAGQRLQIRLSRRDLLSSLLLALALGAVLMLPNAQDEVLAERAKLREALQQQAQQLEQAKQTIQNSALSEEAKKLAIQALEDAQRTLNDPNTTPEQALAAINDAQSKLDALQDLTAQRQEDALQQAGRSLAPDELTNALADSLQRGQLDQAAEQMQQLAAPNGRQLNPNESQRVARQLDQMAQRVQNADPQLAQQMRDAAQSLREGRTEDAQRALQQAAQSMQRANQNARANQNLEQAQQQTEAARQAVTQAAQDRSSAQNRQNGQLPESAQADGQQSSPQGSINSRGQQGQTGQSAQDGQSAQGSAPGTSGGGDGVESGLQGGQIGHSEDSGSDSGVYAPGRLASQGRQVVLPDTQGVNSPNPNGNSNVAPDGDTSVPYQDVYSDYASTADEALQTGAVPADRRDYVRDYFSSLDPRAGDRP
jgi:hypothetical protein